MMVSGVGMVKHEALLPQDLCVRWRRAGRLWSHQDSAVWRDGGREAGCTHGGHGHVGIVWSCKAMVRSSRVEWHHLPIHDLLHGNGVRLLCPPPFGSAVLEPNLQAKQGGKIVKSLQLSAS